MNNLFLLCGKVGSGKTTLAKKICQNFDAVLFSADDFMLKLFGEIEDQKTFNEKLTLCKELIYDTCEKISKKTNVVLDFGFWTKEERTNVKNRLSPFFNVVIVYLNIDDKTILSHLEKRNSNLKENEYFIDEQTFEILSSKFEVPSTDENFISYSQNDDFISNLKHFIMK